MQYASYDAEIIFNSESDSSSEASSSNSPAVFSFPFTGACRYRPWFSVRRKRFGIVVLFVFFFFFSSIGGVRTSS